MDFLLSWFKVLRKAVGPYPQISQSISKNITAALEFDVLKATFSLLAQMYVCVCFILL